MTSANKSAAAREDFASTGVKENQFGALVAFPVQKDMHLCEFAVTDLQPEWKGGKMWFSSMGSGQAITDPFLGLIRKVFFKDTLPNVTEGIFVTMWALQHAIELNPGGINGPAQIGVLVDEGAYMLEDAELQEHIASVEAAEAYLAKYKNILRGEEGSKTPEARNSGRSSNTPCVKKWTSVRRVRFALHTFCLC